ncbi:hypothetical protein ACVIWU_006476 [Bradyrhizobium sp. USDA 4509]
MAEICRKAGTSQAAYFNWKKKYDGLLPTEMRRLKQLEQENGRLKKLVADLSLDKEVLQDVIRRKLGSLAGSASWSTRSVASGRCRSAEPVTLWSLTARPITTAHWFLSLAGAQQKVEIGADTTMKNGPTGRSAIDRRFCCKTTSAQPARQRDQGAKL